jgi:hypothetical protein
VTASVATSFGTTVATAAVTASVATSFGTTVATAAVTPSVATSFGTTVATAAVAAGFGTAAVAAGLGTSTVAAATGMVAAAAAGAARGDALFQALQLQADVFHPLLSPPFFSGFERLGFNSKAPLRIHVN